MAYRIPPFYTTAQLWQETLLQIFDKMDLSQANDPMEAAKTLKTLEPVEDCVSNVIGSFF